MCNEAEFKVVELNLSCPHGMSEKGMGRACGESVHTVKAIAEWVTSVYKGPVYIKITPNWAYADELAIAA